MSTKVTLKKFFEEKGLDSRTYEVSRKDTTHFVESEFLIDVIVNHTPPVEQEKILDTIVKIDFQNGDVHHFLKHLATAYVQTNY
jgi:hypothetical protein